MTTFSHLDFLGEGLYNGEQAQKERIPKLFKVSCKAIAGRFLTTSFSSYDSLVLADGFLGSA